MVKRFAFPRTFSFNRSIEVGGYPGVSQPGHDFLLENYTNCYYRVPEGGDIAPS